MYSQLRCAQSVIQKPALRQIASEPVFISFRRSRKELLCAERNLSRRQANLSPGAAGKFSLLEKQMII